MLQPLSCGDQGGNGVVLSRASCNATVMSCHRLCGWFPSDSRGTATVRLPVLIGAGMRWGKCLHLTLSPPFSDLVKVLVKKTKGKKEKKGGSVVLVLAD